MTFQELAEKLAHQYGGVPYKELLLLCKGCNSYKPLLCFGKNRASSYKRLLRDYKCRKCLRAYQNKQYTENPVRWRERSRIWYANNKHYKLAYQKGLYQKAYQKAYQKGPYKAKKQSYCKRYRMRRRGVEQLGDLIHLDELYQRDNGICGICNESCPREVASMDHIVPISRGGPHIWSNVQLAHHVCNSRKGNSL